MPSATGLWTREDVTHVGQHPHRQAKKRKAKAAQTGNPGGLIRPADHFSAHLPGPPFVLRPGDGESAAPTGVCAADRSGVGLLRL